MDHEKAKREAQELYEAGEKHWGTDESKFNFIIASRSLLQLKATFDEYAKVSYLLPTTFGKVVSSKLPSFTTTAWADILSKYLLIVIMRMKE